MRYKKVLSAVMSAIMAVTAVAVPTDFYREQETICAAEETSGSLGGDVTWTLSDDGVLTISGKGVMYEFVGNTSPFYDNRLIRSVVIEDGVTNIGSYLFDGCTSVESVTIPESVTVIGESAFVWCSSLKEVTIPEGVKSIGEGAFSYCKALKDVNIPASVEKIGNYPFLECQFLQSITVDKANQNYSSVDGVLFNKIGTTVIQYPNGAARSEYAIPDGVTTIGEYALAYSKNLTKVTIPDGVTEIGISAFLWCEKMESVEIPESALNIGEKAFACCESLVYVTLPEKLMTIEGLTFGFCYSLENIVIPGGVKFIGYSAFSYCISLTSVEIPASVDIIESEAFGDCASLESISVASENECYCSQDGVLLSKDGTELCQYPSGRPDEEYTIPDGVKLICSGAFSRNKYLTTVNIADSVEMICGNAFVECELLASVNFGENSRLSFIGSHAFSYNTVLKDIIIGESVSQASEDAFFCSGLESITFKNPQCVIGGENAERGTVCNGVDEDGVKFYNGTICGYTNSTAQEFAEKHGYSFRSLGEYTPSVTTAVTDDDPLTTTTSVSSPDTEEIMGDANGDGKLNVRDAAYIAGALAQGKGDTLPACADYNHDGKVNVRDAAAIAVFLSHPGIK